MPDISSKIMKRQDKVLIVEGKKDQFVIANFMELAGISWPKNSPPVHIQDSGGSDKVPKITENILKGDAWTHVGIVIDADNDANTSWTTLQKNVTPIFLEYPYKYPTQATGMVNHPTRN